MNPPIYPKPLVEAKDFEGDGPRPDHAVGFRAWSYAGNGLLEAIVTKNTGTWNSAVVEARCPQRPEAHGRFKETIPVRGCSCGLYSLWCPEVEGMKRKIAMEAEYSRASGIVWGVVIGYGKVIVADEGFRAQKMKMLGLLEMSDMGRAYALDVGAASIRYGVETHDFAGLVRLADEWGAMNWRRYLAPWHCFSKRHPGGRKHLIERDTHEIIELDPRYSQGSESAWSTWHIDELAQMSRKEVAWMTIEMKKCKYCGREVEEGYIETKVYSRRKAAIDTIMAARRREAARRSGQPRR